MTFLLGPTWTRLRFRAMRYLVPMPIRVLSDRHFDNCGVADTELCGDRIHERPTRRGEPGGHPSGLSFFCHTRSVHCLKSFLQCLSCESVYKLRIVIHSGTIQSNRISGGGSVAGLLTSCCLLFMSSATATRERQRPPSGGVCFTVVAMKTETRTEKC